ncbi:MAG TPA: serine/threonine-protein kinase, partial [Polyangiaceae bacterium]|nr:serine/threonine-protein kinase [Polyangiaceae bacterium]
MPLKFLGQDTGVLPRIDRYELIAELASGGMASVYLARLVGMGGFERFFAIKRLHPHLGHEEAFVSMFLDEARIVAGIRHQHVVPVLEVGASDHGYYLVMEYIEGENLGTFLTQAIETKSPIPPNVVVRILLDVLAGLHAAHEHVDADGHPIGLVHRDVSPQNILIDTNGVARIADFGVAHATSRLSSTRSGQLKGKVAYMAPEQARGEGVSPRSDVFAAAIVLWESLTSRRLFLANNEAVTLNRLLFEPIPELEEVAPSIPRGIARVLARALQRAPA